MGVWDTFVVAAAAAISLYIISKVLPTVTGGFFFCVTCIGKRIHILMESALAPYSRSIALLLFREAFRRSPRFCFVFVEVSKIYQATFAGVPAVLFR